MPTMAEIINDGCISGYDESIYNAIRNNWDKISKPIDSMGEFEHLTAKIGAVQNTEYPRFDKVVTAVFAADNGIVEAGVSQCGQDVTAICANGIADGKKSVNVMAALNNIEVQLIDVGVNAILKSNNVIDKKIRKGTRNFAIEPSMTEAETMTALGIGFELAKEYKNNNYDIICLGEIGIGNTTTSSAVIASILKVPAQKVTGRGAGLTNEGLIKKISIIDEAIKKYNLYDENPIGVLQKVGGYDIASMTGLIIGASYYKIPVVLDGLISSAAALLANELVDGVNNYMIPSHSSAESASLMVLNHLKLKPVINANMALGEGTGAVLMIPMIRTAYEVYKSCTSFNDDGIKAYEHLK